MASVTDECSGKNKDQTLNAHKQIKNSHSTWDKLKEFIMTKKNTHKNLSIAMYI